MSKIVQTIDLLDFLEFVQDVDLPTKIDNIEGILDKYFLIDT